MQLVEPGNGSSEIRLNMEKPAGHPRNSPGICPCGLLLNWTRNWTENSWKHAQILLFSQGSQVWHLCKTPWSGSTNAELHTGKAAGAADLVGKLCIGGAIEPSRSPTGLQTQLEWLLEFPEVGSPSGWCTPGAQLPAAESKRFRTRMKAPFSECPSSALCCHNFF